MYHQLGMRVVERIVLQEKTKFELKNLLNSFKALNENSFLHLIISSYIKILLKMNYSSEIKLPKKPRALRHFNPNHPTAKAIGKFR